MIEKFCTYLTKKIGNEMPELTEERLEAINYGLQILIGELPKLAIIIVLAFLLGIGKLTLLSYLVILPYRNFAGGFHAKTHLGCIICSFIIFCTPAIVAPYIYFDSIVVRYFLITMLWFFAMIMIRLYAPADTENVPILRKKERKQKQILSFSIVTIELIIAAMIQNITVSNVIMIGILLETITITRIAYKITRNKYGYEVYDES